MHRRREEVPASARAAFLVAGRNLGGANLTLLRLQEAFDKARFSVDAERCLRAFTSEVCGGSSVRAGNAAAAAAGAGDAATRSGREAHARRALRAAGLDAMYEMYEPTSAAGAAGMAPPSFAGIRKLPVVVEGVEMGSVYMRNPTLALFYALTAAPPGAFRETAIVEPEDGAAAGVAGGFAHSPLMISEPMSTPSFDLLAAALDTDTDPIHSAASALKMSPTPLFLTLQLDETTVMHTAHTVYFPLTGTVGNLPASLRNVPAVVMWLALLPVLKNPFEEASADYKIYARRATLARHAAMDIVMDELHALRSGILYEISPGRVLLLAPRIFARITDFPEHQKCLALKASARANMPCRFCYVKNENLLVARLATPRSPESVASFAATDPRIPPPGTSAADRSAAKRARDKADAAGVVAIGRSPWPLTTKAAAVSSQAPAHLMGELEILHVVAGILMRLFRESTRIIDRHTGVLRELYEAMSGVLSYRGPFSHVRSFRAAQFIARHIESTRLNDILAVLPMLLADLPGLPDDVRVNLTRSLVALHRLVASIMQLRFSEADCERIDREACVLVRALRADIFEGAFSRMIKSHHPLHYGERIRLCGARLGLDVAHLERYHIIVKALDGLVGNGDGKEGRMLALHGQRALFRLVVASFYARAEALDGDASSFGGAAAGAAAAAAAGGGGGSSESGAAARAPPPLSTLVGALASAVGADPLAFVSADSIASCSGLGGCVSRFLGQRKRTATASGGTSEGSTTPVRGDKGALIVLSSRTQPGLERLRTWTMATSDAPSRMQLCGGANSLTSAVVVHLLGRKNSATGSAWTLQDAQMALRAATTSSGWAGRELGAADFSSAGGLNETGAAALIAGGGVRVHASLQLQSRRESGAPASEGLRVYPAPVGVGLAHHASASGGGGGGAAAGGGGGGAAASAAAPSRRRRWRHSIISVRRPLASGGETWAVCELIGLFTIPSLASIASRSGGSTASAPATLYVLVRLATRDEARVAALEAELPGCTAVMEPYTIDVTARPVLLPALSVIRSEHVQPKFYDRAAPGVVPGRAFWRGPPGGLRGRAALIAGGSDGDDGEWSVVSEESEEAAQPEAVASAADNAAEAVEEEEEAPPAPDADDSDNGEALFDDEGDSDSDSDFEGDAPVLREEKDAVTQWSKLSNIAQTKGGCSEGSWSPAGARARDLVLATVETIVSKLTGSGFPRKAATWSAIDIELREAIAKGMIGAYVLNRPLY